MQKGFKPPRPAQLLGLRHVLFWDLRGNRHVVPLHLLELREDRGMDWPRTAAGHAVTDPTFEQLLVLLS